MNIHIKLFPIYGLTDTSHEFDVQAIENATIKDILHMVENRMGKEVPDKGIMLMYNGKVADLKNTESITLKPEDCLWIMPIICGG